MKSANIRNWSTAAAILMAVGLSSAGAKDRGGVDADIDSLHAALYHGDSGYVLDVKYEVEVESGRSQPLDLVIYLIEDGYALVDASGERVAFVIPLKKPTEYDDDEIEFKARVALDVPGDVAIDPWHLSAGAELFVSGDPEPLDHKTDTVKYYPPEPDSSVAVSTSSYGVVVTNGFSTECYPLVYYAPDVPRVYSYGYCIPPRIYGGYGYGFYGGHHRGGFDYRLDGDHHRGYGGFRGDRGDHGGHRGVDFESHGRHGNDGRFSGVRHGGVSHGRPGFDVRSSGRSGGRQHVQGHHQGRGR